MLRLDFTILGATFLLGPEEADWNKYLSLSKFMTSDEDFGEEDSVEDS